ncbi:MAG: hypothetical protein AAFX76_10020, partial [Planctomycetota bacterium]
MDRDGSRRQRREVWRSATLGWCIAVLAAASAIGQTPDDTLRIGSWNLDLHRVNAESGGWQRNPSGETLAAVFRLMSADVVVLQEVAIRVDRQGPRPRNPQLTEALRRLDGDWEHVLVPTAYTRHSNMATGVAWNRRRVSLVNGPLGWKPPVRHREVGGSRAWLRPPHGFKFSAGEGRTDFV